MTIKEINSTQVNLHNSQGLIQVINANTTYCLWQRAGGKTGGGIGPRFVHLNNVMPRSQILLFSDTYDRLRKRIVPNITHFLTEKLGLIEGIDFVKYKKPPEHFEKPIIPLDDFENVISTSFGTSLCLVSLRVEGSANAYSAQAAIGDEVKYCDEQSINTEVIPALRGEAKRWQHLPEYLSVWMFTDKFGQNTKWLLAKRKKVDQEAVKAVYALQMQALQWEQEKAQYSSSGTIAAYNKKIEEYTKAANEIRKNLLYVSEMKPYENKAAVGDRFFKIQRRICTPYEFNVAILNQDPDQVEQTFYPMFSSANKYAGLDDYNPELPFIVSMDYNFRIAPLPVAQVGKLPGSEYTTINFINALYTLYPEGMKHAIKLFCEQYASHRCKEINYVFDHTAIGRNTLLTTYKDSFIQYFSEFGWIVHEHYIGEAPEHNEKYKELQEWLTNTADLAVRVNSIACEQLIKSIEQSPAIISNGITKKDKRTEKNPKFPAEDSTHFSDAFDMILIAVLQFGVRPDTATTAMPIRIG